MSTPRRSLTVATVLASVSLAGCGGLGLPPAAPVLTGGPTFATTTSTPATPSDTPATGSPTTAPPTDAPSTPSPTPSTPAPETSTGPQDTVSRMPGGNGSATPLLVATSDLPSGWTAMPARDTRGYRMTVCGVDLEPTEPVDAAQQNWRRSAAGPYLEQHVRVYPDATATAVVAGLTKAIPGCRTYTAKDAKGSSTFTVQKVTLKDAPEGTIAWRQRVPVPVPGSATGSAPPQTAEVVQDVAVRRTGASIVLFTAYAVGAEPDDAALVTALRATG